jgi:sugar/nucleoside kinase (ribokinase family)
MCQIIRVGNQNPKNIQVAVITDGGNGAWAYDGKNYYFCPVFKEKGLKVASTIGAGDAFASTFFAKLTSYKVKDWSSVDSQEISHALKYASVNAASVCSKFGATEGALTLEQISTKLNKQPGYSVVII